MNECAYPSFRSLLESAFSRYSGRTALKSGETAFTYGQLEPIIRSNACRILQASDASRALLRFSEKRISAASYAGVLSTLLAGKCAVMVPEYLDPETVSEIAAEYGADLIISDEPVTLPHLQCVVPALTTTAEDQKTLLLPARNQEDDCFVLFTSGTTEKPKGVLLTHGNVIAAALGGTAISPYSENDVYVSCIPCYHGYSLICDLTAVVMSGACLCAATSAGLFRDIQFYRPTCLNAVPELIKVSLRAIRSYGKDFLGGRLASMRCGGAGMDPSVYAEMASYGISVYNCYGLTELTAAVSASGPDCLRIGSAGKVIPGNAVRISEDGEILVKGNTLFKGYLSGEGLTEPGEWFATGDLGRLDDDGFLFVLGRADSGIILENGEKIIPEQVELWLQAFPCIREAMVCFDPAYTGLSALIVTDNDLSDISDAVESVNLRLPSGARISHFTISARPLKRNQLGKLIRRNHAADQ